MMSATPEASEPMASSPRRARIVWGVVAGLIALLHLFVNGLHLADRELWLDEASTWGVAAHSFWRNFTLPIEFHSQPPLYYLLLHFLGRIDGDEWFIRGFSWLLILGLIAFVLFCLDELARHTRAALAFVLVYGSFSHFLAQELRPYALSALTTFVATIFFLRALADPTPRRVWRYAVAATLMLYSLAFDVWPFVAHGLFLLGVAATRAYRRAPLAELRPLFFGLLGVLVAYLPYLAAAYHWQGHSGFGKPTWHGAFEAMLAVPYLDTLQSFLPIGPPYSPFLLGLVLLVGLVEVRARRADFLLWLLIIVGQLAFVNSFLFGRVSVANRYYTPAYPALLFLVALGMQHALTATRRLWWIVPIVLAALAWQASGPFVASARAPLPADRWRALARALAAVPGRKLIFFDVGYNGQMLEYAARRDHQLTFALQKGTFWASGGDYHLDREYIESTIAREAPTTRCFYYLVEASPGPYQQVFLPAMQRLGYRQAASPGTAVSGFCKP